MCRGGKAVVWDLANEDQEHWFSWTPGQLHTRPSEAKPAYRFRTCWYVRLRLDSHCLTVRNACLGCILYIIMYIVD